GGRNGDTDKQSGAESERRHADDHDEQDRQNDGVGQRADLVADVGGLIADEGNVDAGGDIFLRRSHHLADRQIVGDNVGADALRYVDGDGALAVDGGERRRVVEGGVHLRHVLQRHGGVGAGADRQVQNIGRIVDDARNLYGEIA